MTPSGLADGLGPWAGRGRLVLGRLFRPFWVVPALWCLGAVGAGVLVPELDDGISDWVPFVFRGGVEGARTVLSTIAGAMISVTGLVFSITMVVLQLASSQFSPRVLQTFLQDRVTQNALGVFAASFLYSLTVLRSVEDQPGSSVPQLAVTLSFTLVLAAVAMFLVFIHHITQSISVTTVIRRVGDDTRALLDRRAAALEERPDPGELPRLPRQIVTAAGSTGYVDAVDTASLCAAAAQEGTRVELLHRLGSFVTEGSPLALVHGDQPDRGSWEHRVGRWVTLSRDRTTTQDISFGFRRLVDISERALSPGVNDPTTATQAVDELHDLLRRLVPQADPSPVWCDGDGTPRVVVPELDLAGLLDLAVDEIAHWGADDLQVPRRLALMFEELEHAAAEQHRETVRAKARQVEDVTSSRRTRVS